VNMLMLWHLFLRYPYRLRGLLRFLSMNIGVGTWSRSFRYLNYLSCIEGPCWCVIDNIVLNTYVEIKCQLDATEVFISDLIACSLCFGHHYAHHQKLKSITQWLLPVVFRAVWCCNILQTGQITLSPTPDQQLENHSAI